MRHRKRIALITLVAVGVLSVCTGASELIDGIEAVVGDYVVLKSEVDFQLQLWAMQQNRSRPTPDEIKQVRDDLLEQMVNDKLILISALKDTSISVTSEEIEQALDYKLEELRGRFPSQAEFERQMAVEGLTLRELKSKFRDEMRNQLYKDRLIQSKLRDITVLPSEVTAFFKVFKDSLPPHPEGVKLAHLLLEVKPTKATLDSALGRAREVEALLKDGGDFAELAMQYSDDPSASDGGDLGYFGRGDLVEEFEKAAFGLEPGGISDIVKTQYGYHIIKCEDRVADRIRCRHILCMAKPTESDKLAVISFADSLRTVAMEGGDFSELVKQYSIDEETRKQGGELGWFVQSDLTPEFMTALQGVEVDGVSTPTESQFGIHILKLLDRQTSRSWSLDDDMDRLKEIVKRRKTESVVSGLIKELQDEVYVDIRNK